MEFSFSFSPCQSISRRRAQPFFQRNPCREFRSRRSLSLLQKNNIHFRTIEFAKFTFVNTRRCVPQIWGKSYLAHLFYALTRASKRFIKSVLYFFCLFSLVRLRNKLRAQSSRCKVIVHSAARILYGFTIFSLHRINLFNVIDDTTTKSAFPRCASCTMRNQDRSTANLNHFVLVLKYYLIFFFFFFSKIWYTCIYLLKKNRFAFVYVRLLFFLPIFYYW